MAPGTRAHDLATPAAQRRVLSHVFRGALKQGGAPSSGCPGPPGAGSGAGETQSSGQSGPWCPAQLRTGTRRPRRRQLSPEQPGGRRAEPGPPRGERTARLPAPASHGSQPGQRGQPLPLSPRGLPDLDLKPGLGRGQGLLPAGQRGGQPGSRWAQAPLPWAPDTRWPGWALGGQGCGWGLWQGWQGERQRPFLLSPGCRTPSRAQTQQAAKRIRSRSQPKVSTKHSREAPPNPTGVAQRRPGPGSGSALNPISAYPGLCGAPRDSQGGRRAQDSPTAGRPSSVVPGLVWAPAGTEQMGPLPWGRGKTEGKQRHQ